MSTVKESSRIAGGGHVGGEIVAEIGGEVVGLRAGLTGHNVRIHRERRAHDRGQTFRRLARHAGDHLGECALSSAVLSDN